MTKVFVFNNVRTGHLFFCSRESNRFRLIRVVSPWECLNYNNPIAANFPSLRCNVKRWAR